MAEFQVFERKAAIDFSPFFCYTRKVGDRKVRIVFFIIILVLLGVMALSIFQAVDSKRLDQVFRFDFGGDEKLDDFWLVSNFGSFERVPELARVEDGYLELFSSAGSRVPMFVSKPIDVPPGSVITIKRKIRITRGEGVFAGGLAMYQTDDENQVPRPDGRGWYSSLGDCMGLIEYSYDLLHMEKRPGKDVFRFLPADWELNQNYEIFKPIYGEWVEEVFSYDTRTNALTYKIGQNQRILTTFSMDKPAVRVVMHAYGNDPQNLIEIDYIEISVADKSYRGRK